MGGMQNNEAKTRGKRKSRGSVRNSDRLADFGKGNLHTGADWAGCDPKRIQAVVTGITSLGGAVTFGLSRDLGAHSLTLMLSDSRKTLWFNGSADLDDELDAVIGTLAAMD